MPAWLHRAGCVGLRRALAYAVSGGLERGGGVPGGYGEPERAGVDAHVDGRGLAERVPVELHRRGDAGGDLLHSSTFHGMPPGCFSRGSGAVLFAVPEGGYTLHLTGLRSRCRALT